MSLLTKEIDDLIAWSDANIARRQAELDNDERNNQIVEDRIMTEKLASVQGIEKYLKRVKSQNESYKGQEVMDPHSHATSSRAAMHKR